MRLITRLLMIAAASLLIVPMVAYAAPRGVLTDAEYQQLSVLQTKVDSVAKQGASAVGTDRSVCNARPVSGLVGAVLSDCRSLVAWLRANLAVRPAAARCKRVEDLSARFNCLGPSYQRVSTTTAAYYRDELRVQQDVVRRGFSRDCVLALAESSKTIAAERRMAADAAKLASGLRSHNAIAVQKYAGEYEVDAADAEGGTPNQPLTVCPHE